MQPLNHELPGFRMFRRESLEVVVDRLPVLAVADHAKVVLGHALVTGKLAKDPRQANVSRGPAMREGRLASLRVAAEALVSG